MKTHNVNWQLQENQTVYQPATVWFGYTKTSKAAVTTKTQCQN